MSYLSFSEIALIIIIVITTVNTSGNKLQNIKEPRLVQLKGCKCDGLECNCCANTELANNPDHEVCAKFTLIPNEVTFRATLSVDGNTIFTRQLDPSIAPICAPPIGGLCLAVNHVDLQRRQVCTKLYAIFLTLVKFPCVGAEDGKLVVEPNSYT